jgi:hypothetical protein
MTNIANLFINMFTDESKPPDSITDTAFKYKKEKSKKKANTPALSQGDKFLFYQTKIAKNLAKENQISNDMFVEGFNTSSGISSDGITNQSKELLSNTNMSSEKQKLISLKKQYNESLAKYQLMLSKIKDKSAQYFDRVSQKNPYLNQVIVFTTGHCCAVTNQGVVKYIPSWDYYTNATGITNPKLMYLDIPLPADFWTPGTIVPTTPPLISGTTLTSDQTLGNEGTNVFVDKMLSSNASASYVGVYGNNSPNPLTFVGGSPPITTSLQNGNFDVPALKNGEWPYVNDSTTVPGWTFTSYEDGPTGNNRVFLMNNASDWGYPKYPNGPQAVCLQQLGSISQVVQLSPGTYTISFMACGRNSGANPLAVKLNGNIVYTAQPTVNVWSSFSTPVTVTTNGANTISFAGTSDHVDRSSAIQNIQLTGGDPVTTAGTYTYDMCKQAAINNGNQYFGLQFVNSTTSTGYCAMTNDYVGATQPGTNMIATATTALWASNTASTGGVSASLNRSGALCVYDSAGKAIYSSPNSEAQPGNYYGCYNDNGDRAMPLYNGGSQQYDLSGCQNLAIKNNSSYFGLQNSTSGTNAQCVFTNDFMHSVKYGKAGNCTNISNGTYSGGGWSNAVYNTWSPSVNYYLYVQDDGNLVVYRGMGPNDDQGIIWASGTNGQQQDANPAYAAGAGKYGRNYITVGQTLAPGDFVGSTNGTTALVMQSDGNLVLYTWTMGQNSQTMADGNTGGGQGATAIYKLTDTGIPSNLGKLGYIDENAELHNYPSTNAELVDAYSKVPDTDSGGSDYQVNGAYIYGNATVEDCENTCNSYDDCYGFVTYNGVCYPKTSGMSYNGTGVLPGGTLYTRNKVPSTVPSGASNTVINTDTVSFKNYANGGELAKEYGLTRILNSSPEQAQLSQMEVNINALANEISSLSGQFETNYAQVGKQINKNIKETDVYLSKLQKTKHSIQNMTTGISNVLENSDIVVLQKNYDYLFWSVLAVGVVLVSVNVVKK